MAELSSGRNIKVELSTGRNTVKIGSQVVAAIFDSLDKIDANRFAYTKVEGKEDIIDLAIGENGRLDPEKASRSLLICEVDPQLLSDIRSEFVKARIPSAWQNYIEPAKEGQEFAKMRSYLVFPKSEERAANAVIEDYMRIKPERSPQEPRALLEWIKANEGGSTRAAGLEIDKDLYDYINRAGLISIPRAEMGENELDHAVRLRVPLEMGDGVIETVKIAETLYTGDFRRIEQEREAKLNDTVEKLLAGSKNDMHNSIIINAEAPSQYIRLDRDGFKYYIDTEAGPNLIAGNDRNDRSYEQELYNILRSFGGFKEISGKDEELEEGLRKVQAEGQQLRGISVDERVHELKKEYVEDFMRACEIVGTTYQLASSLEEQQGRQEDHSRMKDDVIKMDSRLDDFNAMGLGNSTAAGDLRGDMAQIKGMILSSFAAETSKDMSDLYDGPGWDDFLTRKLCLDAHEGTYKTEALGQFKEMASALSMETPEVQEAFREEFSKTIHEVFEINYHYQTEPVAVQEVDLGEEISERGRETELSLTR